MSGNDHNREEDLCGCNVPGRILTENIVLSRCSDFGDSVRALNS
jgi:hypothetical protein